MQILVVDDDEATVEVLTEVLQSAGHEVQAASGGLDALRRLPFSGCRLVICDWNMPGISGEEFCRTVRAQDFDGYVYIILLTGYKNPEYMLRGLTAGADEFLTKPFNNAELTLRIRTAERMLSLETRDVAIFAMAKLAESRDPETGSHLERMRVYSHMLARHLSKTEPTNSEVNAEYVRLIYLTSPLHDIGKVGIPDGVLLKPSRLSDREFEVMKTHTLIGAQTLDAAARRFPAARFLQMARDIALSHHERYDGSGYPNGLVGDKIPLAGRIVALADVYDALTSRRVYKKAFDHDIARSMIVEESGSHFDPLIVQAFLANEQEFVAVHEQFAENAAAVA